MENNEQMFANVIVDVSVKALDKSFVFKVPKNLIGKVKAGDKIIFPFGKGNKNREGFLLELLTLEQLKNKNFYKNDAFFKKEDAMENIKEIVGHADNKIGVNEILLKMAIFLCKEYYTPISICLNTVMPVKKQIRKNARQLDAIKKYKIDDVEKKKKNDIVLNEEQLKIFNDILNEIKKNIYNEHLIFGITGSGKTEIYINVIEEVINNDKQVIVMIPEIALTHQTVIRLKEKFGEQVAIIHSRMSDGDKYIQYNKCENGEAKILVGPRSAIFAPFENLGLIVIDEVNDDSYKSETNPKYNTLNLARFRCKEQNATLLSLSATPKIAHFHDAKEKKIENIHFHKLTKRANSVLPLITIIDMKNEIKKGNKSLFSHYLKMKIEERLMKNEQVMLFMNRRGYDTIFTCKACGETYKCPHCDVSLVTHSDGKMKCHYCGYETFEPLTCPICKSKEIEKYGIGTEKLEEMCIDIFPKAKVLRMDRDTTKEKDGHDKIIEKFRNHEADILLGTQMIVKGHDFPLVTLVAVMRADLTLYTDSYKSSENAFSMLTQCVGRSGRAKKGEAIIQGYDIDNYVIKQIANQNYEKFYEEEIVNREKLSYPPFGKILYIKLTSINYEELYENARNLKLYIETKCNEDIILLGPTKGNPEKIKNEYIINIFVKCKNIDIAKKVRRMSYNFASKIFDSNLIKINFDIE